METPSGMVPFTVSKNSFRLLTYTICVARLSHLVADLCCITLSSYRAADSLLRSAALGKRVGITCEFPIQMATLPVPFVFVVRSSRCLELNKVSQLQARHLFWLRMFELHLELRDECCKINHKSRCGCFLRDYSH